VHPRGSNPRIANVHHTRSMLEILLTMLMLFCSPRTVLALGRGTALRSIWPSDRCTRPGAREARPAGLIEKRRRSRSLSAPTDPFRVAEIVRGAEI
jgi:hypothetical protein